MPQLKSSLTIVLKLYSVLTLLYAVYSLHRSRIVYIRYHPPNRS